MARASATIALKTFAAAEKDIVCEADRRRAKNGWNLNSTYSHENRKTTTRKSALRGKRSYVDRSAAHHALSVRFAKNANGRLASVDVK